MYGGVTLKSDGIKDLERRIEDMRQHMYQTYLENPGDPRLVIISQKLDQLLNELWALKNSNE